MPQSLSDAIPLAGVGPALIQIKVTQVKNCRTDG
jgi:hypothetical protein